MQRHNEQSHLVGVAEENSQTKRPTEGITLKVIKKKNHEITVYLENTLFSLKGIVFNYGQFRSGYNKSRST